MARLLHLELTERDVTYLLETDDSIMFSDLRKELTNMLTSILGARFATSFNLRPHMRLLAFLSKEVGGAAS